MSGISALFNSPNRVILTSPFSIIKENDSQTKNAPAGAFLLIPTKFWLQGLDLNQRPLGYESARKRNFNKLANTDGPAKPRKES
jgi:hypothetical protein